jgi:hypothetical protein
MPSVRAVAADAGRQVRAQPVKVDAQGRRILTHTVGQVIAVGG